MRNIIDQARALADAGNISGARAMYSKVLKAQNDDPDLLEEVGFFEVQAGRFSEAIGLMKLALKFRPNDPTSHLNVAEAYRLCGAHEEAKGHYQHVIDANPQDADAWFGMAGLAVTAERWSEASNYLERVIDINPKDAESLHLHASVLLHLGEPKKGEKRYLEALALQPNVFEIIVDLARLYYEGHRLALAIKYYLKAENISPLPDDDLLNLSHALMVEGRAQEAVPIAHKLMMSPNLQGKAIARRAAILQTLGMFKEAEKDLRTALRVDPQAPNAYEQLATMRRLTDQDITRLERLINLPGVPNDRAIGYHFALYNGYKDRKQYEVAFENLKHACDLHLEESPVVTEEIVKNTTHLIEVFDKSFFEEHASFGHEEPGAIFIVGMPRSGTTLTERVLAAHPNVIARGERYAVTNMVDEIEGYPEELRNYPRDAAAAEGRRLLQDMRSIAKTEQFATDKMPGNFRNIALITRLLPNARIIWCKRNPIDNCLSCYEQHFSSGWNFSFSLEALGVAYRQHERLMHHWMDVCPIPIHTVEYEKLVSEPEKTARSMLDYVGLEWDPSCLNPEDVDSNIATASVYQARQPINTGSVEKWRRYEKQLQPLIRALEEN